MRTWILTFEIYNKNKLQWLIKLAFFNALLNKDAFIGFSSSKIFPILSYPSWWVEGIFIIGVRPGPEPRNDYFRETDNQFLLQRYMLNGTSNEEKYR